MNSNSLLLGAIDNLPWTDIKPWAISARESGFDGEIWLVTYRINPTEEFEKFCETYSINQYHVEHDALGQPIQHAVPGSPTVAHNLRFYHFWELAYRLLGGDKKYCIATDVRDVIFQKNPMEYLTTLRDHRKYVAASEGIKYEKEEWGKNNILQGFGKLAYDVGQTDVWDIHNVGVLAGRFIPMIGLFSTIYNFTHNRQYYPSDQSSYNVILSSGIIDFSDIEYANHNSGWACQCGTTADPTKSYLWERLSCPLPIINNGEAFTSNGEKYHIVHQWDRNPELKRAITERYK